MYTLDLNENCKLQIENFQLEPTRGFEPRTDGLQNRCSTS